MLRIFLDVHGVNNVPHCAVASSIASSHEDLHEVTSMSSCVDLNSQSLVPSILCHKEWTSVWNGHQQPRFILIHKLFQ